MKIIGRTVQIRITGHVPEFVAWVGEQRRSEPLPHGPAWLIVENLAAPWPTFDIRPFLRLRETIITPEGDVCYTPLAAITFGVREVFGMSFLVEAHCENPAAKPHFDYLIARLLRAIPGAVVEVGAADVGGDGSDGSDGDRETAVASQPGAADVGGDGSDGAAVDEAIRRAQIARQYGIQSKTVPMWEEIARLYSAALSQREIAERLDRSERTIRGHIGNMKARGFLPPENSPK